MSGRCVWGYVNINQEHFLTKIIFACLLVTAVSKVKKTN